MQIPIPRSPPASQSRRPRQTPLSPDSVDYMFREPRPHPSEFLEFHSAPKDIYTDLDRKESHESSDASTKSDSRPVSPYSMSSQHPFATSSHRINRELMSTVPDFKNLASEARRATTSEHRMTVGKAIRTYPKAIGWSLLLSLAIVMEGFDITLVSSFFAFPQFQRAFGSPTGDGGFQIDTIWQTALTVGAVVGEIIGLLMNGPLIEVFGNRKVMMASLLALSIFIFGSFFSAQSIALLLVSQVLSGIPWGVFQTLATIYAAEVMPTKLRPILTSQINLCWVLGQLISTGMLRGLMNWDSDWAFRVPFALQWMWTIPIFVGVMFAPESPWWLMRKGRFEDARRSLLRLTRSGQGFKVDETVSMMKHTNEVEKYMHAGTSYWDCFRGTDRRRTEIACMVWITQAVSAVVTANSAYFYEQAGLSSSDAFDLTTGMYVAGILGAVLSWFLMRVFGRRTLYLCGTATCGVGLLIAGIVGAAAADGAPTNSPASWALGALVVAITLVYDSTIGPVCYALVAEIPSTRLRIKTVVLARIAYNIVIIVTNVLMPRMLNPMAWNWKGKSCFLWAALTLACYVWCFFRLPEPKDLTYMELDILFEKRASARKFSRFRGRLAETGYFSLATTEQGEGERNEWHINRRVGHTPLEGMVSAPL